MNKDFREPKFIDIIARIFCILAAATTAICAYIVYANPAQNISFWALSILSITLLLVATVAPRKIRVALVAWIPW
jgi:hypothetical protein